MSYFNCNIDGLNVPLMALVDYRGFRLIAMSILPVDESTIIYGSWYVSIVNFNFSLLETLGIHLNLICVYACSDAGRNIFARDEQFNTLMKKAAKKLNLKPHRVHVVTKDRKSQKNSKSTPKRNDKYVTLTTQNFRSNFILDTLSCLWSLEVLMRSQKLLKKRVTVVSIWTLCHQVLPKYQILQNITISCI